MKDVRKRLGLGVLLAYVLLGFTLPANAQSPNPPGALPTPLPNAQPNPPPQAPPSPAVTSNTPFAGITALGQQLKNDGIYLSLSYDYKFNALVNGGFKTGIVPNGELSFGTVLDLQTILGIPEASFHVTFDERSGYGLAANVGASTGVENNVGPTRSTRLSELFWEQGFYQDRIDVRVGRTNPTLDFAVSELSCEFVTGVFCAQPNTWYASNNNEAFPASTWGGFLNVAATPSIYVRTGVFDDDQTQLENNQHGFNWNVRGSSGLFIPAEVGYQTSFSNARYPSKYDVGGYWDAASYVTPAGVPLQGRTAWWVQGQQTVWRPDPATQQSLTVFAGGITYTGGGPYWSQYYAGLYDRAPFLSRPRDAIGVVGSYYANATNQRPNKPHQWTFELNYGINIVPGLTVKPYTDYIVSPNNLQAPPSIGEPSNAWIVGFEVSINLGQFFGFPQFVAY